MSIAATDAWQSVTLTKDEMWQALSGGLRVHCFDGTEPGDDDGAEIGQRDSVAFKSGQQIHFRRGRDFAGTTVTFVRLELSV